MSRWTYFGKRLILSLPVILFGTTLTFLIIYAGPVDPALAILGKDATAARIEEIHEALGMDQPIWEAWIDFLIDMATFNLGQSWVMYPGVPAWEVIMNFAPRTLLMGAWAILLPLFIGIPLGFFAGLRPNTLSDYAASFNGILWRAMPSFWLALLMLVLLSRSEMYLFGFNWSTFIVQTNITGAPNMKDIFKPMNFLAASKVLIPAGLVLGAASMGNEMRIGRTAFLEAKNSNYVEMARAKGLPGRNIVWKHIFRNALLPLIPVIVAEAGLLIGGSVLVETVFSINGIGWLFFSAVTSGDLPLAASLMYIFIILVVALNILQDLLYTVVDPRVGFER